MAGTHYRSVNVDGLNVFYREVGPTGAPKLLLLHGFPTASHMFRDLIPLLADRFHLIAPDLAGFGKSDTPPRRSTFDRIAETVDHFTELVGFDRYAVYVFDYGPRRDSGSPRSTRTASPPSFPRTGTRTKKV
jgi:pimeloyl-ACP methyl ester carboxylesterase